MRPRHINFSEHFALPPPSLCGNHSKVSQSIPSDADSPFVGDLSCCHVKHYLPGAKWAAAADKSDDEKKKSVYYGAPWMRPLLMKKERKKRIQTRANKKWMWTEEWNRYLYMRERELPDNSQSHSNGEILHGNQKYIYYFDARWLRTERTSWMWLPIVSFVSHLARPRILYVNSLMRFALHCRCGSDAWMRRIPSDTKVAKKERKEWKLKGESSAAVPESLQIKQ